MNCHNSNGQFCLLISDYEWDEREQKLNESSCLHECILHESTIGTNHIEKHSKHNLCKKKSINNNNDLSYRKCS